MQGTVKWYHPRRSSGFIEIGEGKDGFVHKNALTEGTFINEGDSVEFDLEQSPKGPQAVNVRKL